MCIASRAWRSFHDRDDDGLILERERRAELGRRPDRLGERNVKHPPPVDDVNQQPDGQPRQPRVPRRRVLDDDHHPGEKRCGAADEREHRPLDPPDTKARPRAELELGATVLSTQLDNGRMGDRERQHGTERVHRPQEVHLSRQQHEDRNEAREHDEREPGRLEPDGASGKRRKLLVRSHRVRNP